MIYYDQYYTRSSTVLLCLEHLQALHSLSDFQPVEPSAGTGEFLQALSGALAIDIDPRAPGIQRADFLTWQPPPCSAPLMFVGNPPFGKNSASAVKFFNRAAILGSAVTAFIVPRTFRKASLQRRLDTHYHLQSELILPLDSFYTADGPRSVPCVFQVWERREATRPVPPPPPAAPWEWCGREEAETAIRRVGAAAGKIIENPRGTSPSSHLYARGLPSDFRMRMEELYDRRWRTPGPDAKWDVAGNPSLTRGEIAAAWWGA